MSKHIGSLSYTDDNILIYSLYILPPLRRSEKNDLIKYFSKFGEVQSVDMITKKSGNHAFTSAVICFKEPESASKALKLGIHRFSNDQGIHRRISVKSAYSWNQPFQIKLQKLNEIDNDPNINYTILKLNDDCLFLIFQYLSMQDQYNLSNVCPKLENIYESIIKIKKSLYITVRDLFNLNLLKIVLEKIGNNIQCIKFCSSVDHSKRELNLLLNFISKFCSNIYKFEFEGVFLKYNDLFHKICTNFSTLDHIELKRCFLLDDMIKKLTINLSNIKYLNLTDNKKITGLHLENFYNLETLILDSCIQIKSEYFENICSKVIKLKELNINHCDYLNTNVINSLIINLNKLETLTICMGYTTNNIVEYGNIAKLKNLKHLTINESYENCNALLSQLAIEKCNQLETLRIGEFTYDEIKGNSIKKLKNLKQLDLHSYYSSITNQFFNDLSNLSVLKFLNIPYCEKVSYENVLEYLNEAPNTIEVIDLYKLNCDNEFVTRASEILKLRNRVKPLTLTINSNKTIFKKKTFVEDDITILIIKTTPNSYDYLERFEEPCDGCKYSNWSDDYDSD